MQRVMTIVAWIGAMLWTAASAGQEFKEPDVAKELREKRMDLMRNRVAALSAVGPAEEKPEFSEKPLLRYSDTTRDIVDATVWGLGRKGRPRAILVLEVYGGTYVQYELTAIADPPRLVRSARFQWTPRAPQFTWLKVPAKDPPHATQSVRLRQIKQAAQQFTASETWRGQTYQLRMMPQPILQYEDQEQGVLEGAVFVWAHGTNVEILMMLEARQGEGDAMHWVAGFSRLAAASLDVDYNSQDFWTSPENLTANQSSPYFFHSEPPSAEESAAFAPTK
jgi:hypothetical protein